MTTMPAHAADGFALRAPRLVLGCLLAVVGTAMLAFAIYGWARTGQCLSSNYFVTRIKPCPPRFVSDAAAFFAGLVLLPLGTGVALPGGRAMWWAVPGALVATGAGLLAVPLELGGSHPAKIVIGAMLLVMAAAIVLGVLRARTRAKRAGAVLRGGVRGHAVVLACAETKFSVESDATPRNVRLRVSPPDAEPFEWSGRMRFPLGGVPDVGGEIAVRVSPDHRTVVLDH